MNKSKKEQKHEEDERMEMEWTKQNKTHRQHNLLPKICYLFSFANCSWRCFFHISLFPKYFNNHVPQIFSLVVRGPMREREGNILISFSEKLKGGRIIELRCSFCHPKLKKWVRKLQADGQLNTKKHSQSLDRFLILFGLISFSFLWFRAGFFVFLVLICPLLQAHCKCFCWGEKIDPLKRICAMLCEYCSPALKSAFISCMHRNRERNIKQYTLAFKIRPLQNH